MSDAVAVALIGAIQAATIAWLNHQSKKRSTATNAKVEEVHEKVNGQTDALLLVTGQAEKAKGNLEGRAEKVAEDKASRDELK